MHMLGPVQFSVTALDFLLLLFSFQCFCVLVNISGAMVSNTGVCCSINVAPVSSQQLNFSVGL